MAKTPKAASPTPEDFDLDAVIRRLQGEGIPAEKMIVREEPVFEIKIRELRSAIAKNPDHPVAQVYRQATLGHQPNDVVFVDRTDLEALLQNKQVVAIPTETIEVIDGQEKLVTTERKTLVG